MDTDQKSISEKTPITGVQLPSPFPPPSLPSLPPVTEQKKMTMDDIETRLRSVQIIPDEQTVIELCTIISDLQDSYELSKVQKDLLDDYSDDGSLPIRMDYRPSLNEPLFVPQGKLQFVPPKADSKFNINRFDSVFTTVEEDDIDDDVVTEGTTVSEDTSKPRSKYDDDYDDEFNPWEDERYYVDNLIEDIHVEGRHKYRKSGHKKRKQKTEIKRGIESHEFSSHYVAATKNLRDSWEIELIDHFLCKEKKYAKLIPDAGGMYDRITAAIDLLKLFQTDTNNTKQQYTLYY